MSAFEDVARRALADLNRTSAIAYAYGISGLGSPENPYCATFAAAYGSPDSDKIHNGFTGDRHQRDDMRLVFRALCEDEIVVFNDRKYPIAVI